MPFIELNLSKGGKYIKQLSKGEYRQFRKKLKIDERDGSLTCDKFFRQDELFAKNTDKINDGYKTYGIDDIPVKDYSDMVARDINHYETSQCTPYVERGLPPSITLKKTNKKIYLDGINYDSFDFRRYSEMMEKHGLTLEDIANVVHNSFIDGFHSISLREDGLRFLKDGYPLEGVLNIMDISKLNTSSGTQTYASGMMDFMARFPNSRKYVVTLNTLKDETFDKEGAELFANLYDICGDEKLSGKILWDCREIDMNGLVKTNERLGKYAREILKNTGKWTESDRMFFDKVLEKKKTRQEYEKYERALLMMHNGIDTKDIMEIVYGTKPNNLQ